MRGRCERAKWAILSDFQENRTATSSPVWTPRLFFKGVIIKTISSQISHIQDTRQVVSTIFLTSDHYHDHPFKISWTLQARRCKCTAKANPNPKYASVASSGWERIPKLITIEKGSSTVLCSTNSRPCYLQRENQAVHTWC